MQKKVKIELSFDDNDQGLEDIMNQIHDVLRGHAPYINSDIILSTDIPFDGTEFKGNEIILIADFTKENIAKHDLMSKMVMGAMIPILNGITNTMGDVTNIEQK